MKYEESVEHHLNGCEAVSTGLCPGCEVCRDIYAPDMTMDEFDDAWSSGEVCDEGSFSWHWCDICGSHLGGDRYVWHYIDSDGEIQHEDGACVDCVMYLAYGDIPENWEE